METFEFLGVSLMTENAGLKQSIAQELREPEHVKLEHQNAGRHHQRGWYFDTLNVRIDQAGKRSVGREHAGLQTLLLTILDRRSYIL